MKGSYRVSFINHKFSPDDLEVLNVCGSTEGVDRRVEIETDRKALSYI